ncbi:MAG: A24 family peptidase [Candidatus Acidiferrales bacterium]
MNATQLIWGLTLAFVLYAGWQDWHTRRIPNWLTVPGLLLGIAVHAWISGWHGAVMSLEGAGLALVILLPLVLLRALGAGDWKLMGALGAFLGPIMFLFVLLTSAFIAGLMAIATLVWTRRVIATAKNLAVLVQGFFVFGIRPNPKISLDTPGLLKLPFGVAAAIGTVACFVAAHFVAAHGAFWRLH